MTQLFLILSMCISSVLAITVEARNFYYSPSDIVIDAGETVQWENVQGTHDVDGTTNNITNQPWNNPEDFYLGVTGTGDMGSIIFTVPGVYNYDCGVGSHAANGMVGTITVNAVSDQGCQDSDDCEDGSFCNMDYTYDYSSSSCESCGGFTEIEDCYTAGLPDAGEDECAITCFNGDDCSMYGDEYSCDSDDSCYWENDGMGGGYCEHDGPPECVEDCAGIDDLNEDDPYGFCNWITTTLVNSGCADDCEGEELEEVNEAIQECTDCLADNNCEDVIGGDDCEIAGDINGDTIVNILDIVALVNAIVGDFEVDCGDINSDGTINILDIVTIVNIITSGRAIDATSAILNSDHSSVSLSADGYIGGVQMTLIHLS